jgi:hypothetical protein
MAVGSHFHRPAKTGEKGSECEERKDDELQIVLDPFFLDHEVGNIRVSRLEPAKRLVAVRFGALDPVWGSVQRLE